VLLDGTFSLYLPVLKLLEHCLKDGAFMSGDNTLEQVPGYLDYVLNPQSASLRYHSHSMRVEAMN
jgi:hypothetical protein